MITYKAHWPSKTFIAFIVPPYPIYDFIEIISFASFIFWNFYSRRQYIGYKIASLIYLAYNRYPTLVNLWTNELTSSLLTTTLSCTRLPMFLRRVSLSASVFESKILFSATVVSTNFFTYDKKKNNNNNNNNSKSKVQGNCFMHEFTF